MTILGFTLAELLSIAAIIGTAFSFWSQRRYRAAQTAVTFTQADSTNVADALKLKAEYKADLKDLRSELEIEHTARKAVEDQLEAANKIIAELQDRDTKREAAMVLLQKQVEDDKITRDEIVKALTAKVATLEAELHSERVARGVERAEFQKQLDERDKVIIDLQSQIMQLQRGQTRGGLMK